MDNRLIKIPVNDQLYIILTIEKNKAYIEFANFPVEVISITNEENLINIICCEKVIATIDLKEDQILLSNNTITTTEIRNYSEYLRKKEKYQKNKELLKDHEAESIIYPIELHTHFMEVLNAEEFLEIIFRYIDAIPVDEKGNICICSISRDNPKELDKDSVYSWYTKEQALRNEKILLQLRLPTDRQLPFEALTPPLTLRNALIDLVGYTLAQDDLNKLEGDNILQAVKDTISDRKAIIYTDMLIESLEKHKKQGVKYVEFSYSNANTIMKILDELKRRDYKPEGIRYKFLLSENRNTRGRGVKKASNKLRDLLLKYGEVIGFDLMGLEQEILPFEYEETSNNETLYDKLKLIVNTLLNSPREKPTLRLHAGEIYYDNPDSLNNNPLFILEILKKIEDELGINLRDNINIRIGHGLHFNPSEEYFNLLRHFNVIVEICISSNFALSNITDLKDIPINEYRKHHIPYVLGTDGGGFYLTTLSDEAKLASIFSDQEPRELLKYLQSIEARLDGNEAPSIVETETRVIEEPSPEQDYQETLAKHKDDELIKIINNSKTGMSIIKNYFSNNDYELDFEDSNYFPADMEEKDKVTSEYLSLLAYYHDKLINEAYYDSNQLKVIVYSLYKIKKLIDKNQILEAALTIVSLQRLLKVNVKLEKVYLYMIAYNKSYEDYVDIYSFYSMKKKEPEEIKKKEKEENPKDIESYIIKILKEEKLSKEESLLLSNYDIKEYFNSDYKLDLEERKYFDKYQTEKEKIEIEYARTIELIKKKADSGDFTNNQLEVIEETLHQIEELLIIDDLITSAKMLVSLQIVLKMKIKLEKVLFLMKSNKEEISDYIDLNKYFDEKTKERSKKK